MQIDPVLTSVFVVGAGNIGSQLIPLLVALPAGARVGVIDPDRYAPENAGLQRFQARDYGRAKARVQARELAAARPDLAITPYVRRFEQLPLGLFRASVIFACVDGRAARQRINQAAVALGIPWIDAALSRDGQVRARAHLPGASCLECAWSDDEYTLIAQRAPCEGSQAPAAAPTRAPLELGAIAAGLQMALYRRLTGDPSARAAIVDRQFMLDVPAGRAFTATYRANAACRVDHAPWPIEQLQPGSVDQSLREVLALAGADGPASLAAPGMQFVRRLHCAACAATRRVDTVLAERIVPRTCARCGAPMLAAAIDTTDELDALTATPAVLRAPLARRGFEPGDVIALHGAPARRYLQLA